MSAAISSTFDIIINQVVPAGGMFISAAFGTTPLPRSFRLISAFATGTVGAKLVVNKENSVGTLVAQTDGTMAASDLNDFPCRMFGNDGGLPGTLFGPGGLPQASALWMRNAGGGGTTITRVVLVCISGTPQPLTVTLT